MALAVIHLLLLPIDFIQNIQFVLLFSRQTVGLRQILYILEIPTQVLELSAQCLADQTVSRPFVADQQQVVLSGQSAIGPRFLLAVCVMSIEYPGKNHQEFPDFITRIPGKNYEVGVAVCRMSA